MNGQEQCNKCSQPITESVKLESPPAMDQPAGAKWTGPYNNYEEELIWLIHNASILAEIKLEIIQCAVSKSPRFQSVSMGYRYHTYWILPVR